MTHVFVLDTLRSHRFDTSSEATLQEGIRRVLAGANIEHSREAPLGDAGRIDFLVEGGLGIEVKIDGSQVEVMRQLARYAAHRSIERLLLFTTRSKHIDMPRELGGKPVRVLFHGGL